MQLALNSDSNRKIESHQVELTNNNKKRQISDITTISRSETTTIIQKGANAGAINSRASFYTTFTFLISQRIAVGDTRST